MILQSFEDVLTFKVEISCSTSFSSSHSSLLKGGPCVNLSLSSCLSEFLCINECKCKSPYKKKVLNDPTTF